MINRFLLNNTAKVWCIISALWPNGHSILLYCIINQLSQRDGTVSFSDQMSRNNSLIPAHCRIINGWVLPNSGNCNCLHGLWQDKSCFYLIRYMYQCCKHLAEIKARSRWIFAGSLKIKWSSKKLVCLRLIIICNNILKSDLEFEGIQEVWIYTFRAADLRSFN